MTANEDMTPSPSREDTSEQERPILIVDIDNTVLDQDPRKRAILARVLNRTVSIGEVRKSYDLSAVSGLTPALREEFSKEFFSADFYEYARPIGDSVNALIELVETFDIHYISARQPNQRAQITSFLKKVGLPSSEDLRVSLHLLDEWRDLRLESVADVSYEFKRAIVEEIVTASVEKVMGIGDTPEDIVAYCANGIHSILLHNYFNESDVLKFAEKKNIDISPLSFMELDSWQEIRCYIAHAQETAHEIEELANDDYRNYARWMFDLDNKAYLLLIVSTFAATALFTALLTDWAADLNPYLRWFARGITLIGLSTASSAVVLAIRSFGSKHTGGVRGSIPFGMSDVTEEPSCRQWLRLGVSLLLGRSISPQNSPIEDNKLVTQAKYGGLAYLRYLKKKYGSLDRGHITSSRLYSMRAANYRKIYPEIYAQQMLFVTVVIIVAIGVLAFVCG